MQGAFDCGKEFTIGKLALTGSIEALLKHNGQLRVSGCMIETSIADDRWCV